MNIPNPNNGVEAIYYLLASGNRFYRAAAILLLQEYTKTLVANGKGAQASELVQILRDSDPRKSWRPKHDPVRLRP